MSVAEEKPAVDAILLKVLEAVPFQLTTDGGVEACRQRFRHLPRREVHPEVRCEDRTIDGPARPIPIRVYRPPTSSDSPPPVVLFIHGGGWSVGDLDTYDGTARDHAVGAGAVVVSVDYRLAPEHPFPAAVEDAWAATQWVAEHADKLGADPERLAVAGDSAGGNLAAVVSQLARDAGGPRILFQLLWYPATTWDTSLPSFTENANAPILGIGAVKGFSRWYAGGVDLSDPPATLVPARAQDLAGLCRPISQSRATTRCVTTAAGMQNYLPPQVCASNCTTPRRSSMAMWATRGWYPLPRKRPSGDWPRCEMRYAHDAIGGRQVRGRRLRHRDRRRDDLRAGELQAVGGVALAGDRQEQRDPRHRARPTGHRDDGKLLTNWVERTSWELFQRLKRLIGAGE
jgi:acetyl esterase